MNMIASTPKATAVMTQVNGRRRVTETTAVRGYDAEHDRFIHEPRMSAQFASQGAVP